MIRGDHSTAVSPFRAANLAAVVLLGCLLASCGDLGNPVAVRIGDEALTVDDLRRAYADLPVPMRPLLGDPTERREFVEVLVRRKLLAEHGEQILTDRSSPDAELATQIDEILVDRVQIVGIGEISISDEDVERALERMRTSHRVEMLAFGSWREASGAVSEIRSGAASWEQVAQRPHVSFRPAEWIRWSPSPNLVADLAESLSIGNVSDPFRSAGSVDVIRVLERREQDPEGEETSAARIRQGLRAREHEARSLAFIQSLRDANAPRIDEAALDTAVARTTDSFVRSGLTEHDASWGVPDFDEEDASRAVASWAGGGRWTLGDYAAAVRRASPPQRPHAAPLAPEIRRTLVQQIDNRLLLGEARARGLSQDWWVRRRVAHAEEGARVDAALDDIQERIRIPPDRVDSLAAEIVKTQPDAFVRMARSRFVRFDLATREDASAEREEIARAGSGLARLGEILGGAPTRIREFHVMTLSPGGIGVPEIERFLFDGSEPAVTGPHQLGSAWVLVNRLEIQPSHRLGPDEIRSDLTERIRRGEASAAVTNWLERTKQEVGVVVDEDALGRLAPGT